MQGGGEEPDTISREDYVTPRFLLNKELAGKPEGKKPHGRPRGRWEDDIIMDLQEVLWDGVDWIDLALVRDRWRVLVPANSGSIKCGQYFSRTTLLQGVSQSADTNVKLQSIPCTQ